MISLTNIEKIEAAKHYYSSFSDNAILGALIHFMYSDIVEINTVFGTVYIVIDEQRNTISVHTGIDCYDCVELSKHTRS